MTQRSQEKRMYIPPVNRSESKLARVLFEPDSIAIIGASSDRLKHASLPQHYLRRHGFAGKLYPVNPMRDEIFGEQAFASIGDVPGPVDHAIILLKTEAVLQSVAECCAAGVECVTIVSNGFAEQGNQGLALQEELMSLARRAGVRILGPNSLGLVNVHNGATISANEVLSLPELTRGGTALISQSGSLLGSVLSRGQASGLGFSKLVSVGNEADIGTEEIIELLVDDPQTEAILLILETIRRPERFERAAVKAFAAGKPLVAFRLGRSEQGGQLGVSHTGAMVGDSSAIDQFLRDCGVAQVQHIETLASMPLMLRGQRPKRRTTVSIMSTTGGGGTLLVDALASRGVTVKAPPIQVIEKLAAQGIHVNDAPVIDLTLTGANAQVYGSTLNAILEDGGTDLALCVAGSSAQFRPDRTIVPVLGASQRHPGRPLAVFMTPWAEQSLFNLHRHGIPAFLSPEFAADAVRAFFEWRAPRPEFASAPGPDLTEARRLLSAGTGSLDPSQALQVLESMGIAVPDQVLFPADPAKWPAMLDRVAEYPVAVKIASSDIQHKTEIGGVALDVQSPEELLETARAMLARVRSGRPEAVIQGILVEPMQQGLAEVIVGYRRDRVVGPIVVLGTGGVLTEIYRDFAVRRAPLTREGALEMIHEVKGLAPIRGYRNLPAGDLDALAATLAAVSDFARIENPIVLEAEINPVLIRGEGAGAIAVDALIVLDRQNNSAELEFAQEV